MAISSQPEMPSTHWSLVRRAGLDDLAARRAALGELLRRYLPAMRAHLVLGRRIAADRADDLLQGFVGDKVIEQMLFRQADERRGKFRSFLLVSLNHYVDSAFRKAQTHKRGGKRVVPLADGADIVDAAPGPARAFDALWARALIHEVLAAMERGCADRPEIWGVFEARVLPEMRGEKPLSYACLAERFAIQSPAQASNLLMTAKRMYARLLRQFIAEYESDAVSIEREIGNLRAALAAGGGA